MRHLNISLFFTLFFCTTIALAQRVEVGFQGGAAAYLGDLNQYNPLKLSGMAAGTYVKLNFNPRWGLGLHYNYGKIKGFDSQAESAQLRDRNLSFHTPLNEISFLADFNFFDLYSDGSKRKFTPYLFAGIGTIIFNPKTYYNGTEYKLRLFNTEGQAESYKQYALSIPYGAGIRYKITEGWQLFSQIGYRTALTDYLDDVSGVYPTSNSWQNMPNPSLSRTLSDRSGEINGAYIGVPGTQRGDFRKRDTYMFVGIGISYTFVSQKCFTF